MELTVTCLQGLIERFRAKISRSFFNLDVRKRCQLPSFWAFCTCWTHKSVIIMVSQVKHVQIFRVGHERMKTTDWDVLSYSNNLHMFKNQWKWNLMFYILLKINIHTGFIFFVCTTSGFMLKCNCSLTQLQYSRFSLSNTVGGSCSFGCRKTHQRWRQDEVNGWTLGNGWHW